MRAGTKDKGMPNVGTLLREEISRLSRREARRQVESLRKASNQYRRAIAELKRQLATLTRQLGRVSKAAAKGQTDASSTDAGPAHRFAPKGLRAQRARLGLSAAEYAKLAGVTQQSVYNWESGVTRPRAAQIERIASLRGLGKKAARARLEELGAKRPRKSAKR
jgi:DNA-binding transcriptional regulator YiaG